MEETRFFPHRVPIDAYGDGGFRFAEMSHLGSLLILPSGIRNWQCQDASHLTLDDFAEIFAERDDIGFVLLGTGSNQIFPNSQVRKGFYDVGLGLDVMDTGAALRTYNVLLAEKRPVAAALIAVARDE